MEPWKYIVNVEIAVVRSGRYLVVRRSAAEEYAAGVLALPGGKVDPRIVADHVLEVTAKRELFEEVGLKAIRLEYLKSKSVEIRADTFGVDVVFLAEVEPGEPTPGDPAEVSELLWLSAEEVFHSQEAPGWLVDNIRVAQERVEARG
ncbi:MAG: NUDIX domain-containing protein [Trueperaceae bacterium]